MPKFWKYCRQERWEFLNRGNAVVRNDGNSEIVEMLSSGATGILKSWKCCCPERREFLNRGNAVVRNDGNS